MPAKLYGILIVVWAMIPSSSPANADEMLDESVTRGMYGYTITESGKDSLVYWKDAISLQILASADSPNTSFAASHVFTTVFQYSRFSGNPLRFPAGSFMTINAGSIVKPNTNFLVGFLDGLEKEGELNPSLAEYFDYANNDAIAKIVEHNIQRVGEGCFGGWSASIENVVSGFVLLIDEGLSEQKKIECADHLLPIAFGVKPGGVFLSFDNEENTSNIREVFDSSSIGLRIQVAAACRIIGGDRTLSCAQEMLRRFYQIYGELGGWQDTE